jgi:PqqD family protein of HPr-rel-A system
MVVAGPSITGWRLNPVIRLHWRDWGGDSVVFEELSGQTLQFDPLSAAVMACIEAGVTDLSTLAGMLADDLGTVADGPFVESLCTVLERLIRLGWIEPATPAA